MVAPNFFFANRLRFWLVTFPCLVGLCARPARAQSFNCANARAPQERLICASQTLRRLDSELAAAYSAAMARLSEAARLDVRRAQREWLAFWPTLCRDGRAPLNPRSIQAQECATNAYQARLTNLRGDTLVAGGIRLYPLHRYTIAPATAEVEGVRFSTATVSWMLVDLGGAPRNEVAMALAAAIDRWLRDSLPGDVSPLGDADSEWVLAIRSSLPFLLTAETKRQTDLHGSAHGFPVFAYRHFHLTEGRPMIVSDLFALSGWEQPLADWAERALREEMGEDFPELSEEDRRMLHAKLAEPVRWSFSRDALTINSLDGRDLLGNYMEVSVPWSVLAPWLSEPVSRLVAGSGTRD